MRQVSINGRSNKYREFDQTFNLSFFSIMMGFNATFNNISVISWRSVLLVAETGGLGENHRPVASH
jgi:hypothetical protein